MKRQVIVGVLASLVLATATAQSARVSLVIAQLTTIQEEGSDAAGGQGATIPTDMIAGVLNVIWSQEATETKSGPTAEPRSLGTFATTSNSEPPEFADAAMSLGDSAPSLATTVGSEIFASAGDHRPVEISFLPSIAAATEIPLRYPANATDSGSASGSLAPVAASPIKEASPLIDLRLLPALVGVLGATAVGYVATRRRPGKA